MIEFQEYPNCTKCGLCESAKNPGIPTRSLCGFQQVTKGVALLVVGQNPGNTEDKKNESWVGYTGQLLAKFIRAAELEKYCDVYLANACRCRSPQGGDISQAQVRACRDYLHKDLYDLFDFYKEVIIFAIGAKAAYSITNNSSLKDTFKKQGNTVSFQGGEAKKIKVFSTYHLAMLHQMRKPALVRAVEAHFTLLRRYLEGKFIPNEEIEEPIIGEHIPWWTLDKVKAVSCDIETYGILQGQEQTVFNPIKSKYIDGVDFADQVATTNFSWRDHHGKIHSHGYVFGDKNHRKIIRRWFQEISKRGITLVGQNFKFDLMYLASADTELRYWIDPRRLKVDDTLILSFLLYEQQPEKGLKELSTLFGISDYSKMKVTGKSGNAKSPWDKDLHKYNGVDSVTALKMREELLQRIADRYGENSEKLSDVCAWMRNMVVWDTFDLDLNGSTLDIERLQKFHDEENERCQELLETTERDYGIKLAGAGSDKPLRSFFFNCLNEAGLMCDGRVVYTEKEKNISIGVENANLLKKHLPPGESLEIVSNFQEYKERSKIVNTYTRPLLETPRRGIVTRKGKTGMVYPSWYPIPSYFERGGSSDDKVGGQTQGRFSCKKPARQTEPASIRDCSCSRWPHGKLIEYDYNQDHLRMAALLSGDPALLEVYQNEGESIHLKTAADIFPDIYCPTFKKKYPKEYTACKSLNFLVIFKGGPEAFQKVVYKAWQDSLIDLAAKQGYLVLPTGWSRTFGLGPSGVANYTNEICNFMHQTPCAQLTQSAHYQIMQEFRDLHLKTVICLQIYDALFADIYPGEEEVVDEIIIRNMEHPYVLDIFYEWAGREVRWVTEKRVYA